MRIVLRAGQLASPQDARGEGLREAFAVRCNLLVYGVGGLVAPFIGIKAIDLVVAAAHLV